MGREIKRVPLDFSWPIDEVWEGFINPLYKGRPCVCKHGLSPQGEHLHDQWYGYASFIPEKPFGWSHPAVLAFAKRNVSSDPGFYGATGNFQLENVVVIRNEAERLAGMWDNQWCHHLDAADVQALLDADRLWDFTRVARTPADAKAKKHSNGWLKKSNGYVPTPDEVNEWSIRGGLGHDSTNAYICIEAKCKRMGVPYRCVHCDGTAAIWDNPADYEAWDKWEKTEPPTGPGFQLWETVTEGSPQSPVFATEQEFFDWLVDQGYTPLAAKNFIGTGWVPSAIMTENGVKSGIHAAEEFSNS
jgi:hypothetical protein